MPGIARRGGPQAHAVVLEHRCARPGRLAEHRSGKSWRAIHRQRRARLEGASGGAPRTLGACTPSRPSKTQAGSGAALIALPASMSASARHSRTSPASRRPARSRKGPCDPAEAPAHGEVDVAGVVGDVGQVEGAVMEDVAEDAHRNCACGWLLARSWRTSRPDCGSSGWPATFRRHFAGARAVVLLRQVEHDDGLAVLAEDAGPVFWPSAPLAIRR
jgi:hypothetical protein